MQGADASEVRATLFVGEAPGGGGGGGPTLAVAVANWSPDEASFRLVLDWNKLSALGLAPSQPAPHSPGAAAGPRAWRLRAPAIEGFQPPGAWRSDAALAVQGKGSGFNEGWLLELRFV